MSYIAKFNPYSMDNETILAVATGRKQLLSQVLGTLTGNLDTSSVAQHFVIRGPRGMGKSFFLKYLQINFNNTKKFKNCDFLLLPEEQNNVNSPSDLIKLILNQAKGHSGEKITSLWEEPEDVWQNELSELKKYISEKKKLHNNYMLVVVIENLNDFLRNIKSDKKTEKLYESRFRHLLEKIKYFTVIVATPVIESEATDGDYNSRLFHAFKKYKLRTWTEDDYSKYFERRKNIKIEEQGVTFSKEQTALMKAKLKALSQFTGGSPRMAVVLTNLLLDDDLISTVKTLFGLIDDLTPYYQDLTKSIPPKSKILFDTLIRKGENLSQSELAKMVGATQSKVSKAFLWLKDNGYIIGKKRTNSPAFSYKVADRIHVLYYQLREIHHDKKITPIWLLSDFLVAFYQENELQSYANKYLTEQPSREANDMAKVYLLSAGICNEEQLPDFEKSEEWLKYIKIVQKRELISVAKGDIFNKKFNEIKDLIGIGKELFGQSKFKEAKINYEKAYTLSKKHNDILLQALTLSLTGLVLRKLEKQDKAFEYHKQALKLFKKEKNINGQILNLSQIAKFLSEQKKHEKSIEYYKKIIELSIQENNKKEQAKSLTQIGLNFLEIEEHNKAIKYHKKALIINEQINDTKGQAVNLEHISVNLYKLKRFNEAIKYAQKAVDLSIQEKNIDGQILNFFQISSNLQQIKKYKEAIEYNKKVLKLCQKHKSNLSTITTKLCYEHIVTNYKGLKNHQDAIKYLVKFYDLVKSENNIIKILWVLMQLVESYILIDDWDKATDLLLSNLNKNGKVIKIFSKVINSIEVNDGHSKAFETANRLLHILKEKKEILNVNLSISNFFAGLLNMKTSKNLFIDICEEALYIFPEKDTQLIINAGMHSVKYIESGKDEKYLEQLDPDTAIAIEAIVKEASL